MEPKKLLQYNSSPTFFVSFHLTTIFAFWLNHWNVGMTVALTLSATFNSHPVVKLAVDIFCCVLLPYILNSKMFFSGDEVERSENKSSFQEFQHLEDDS